MQNSYKTLLTLAGIHTIIMFLLTYATISSLNHFVPNINRFYMALIMVMPMIILMLAFMHGMFKNTKLTIALYATSTVIFILAFMGIRSQAFVGDEQFLRSMIPHHSGAITMCERSDITDQEIKDLCDEIVQTQKEEINQMNQIRSRLAEN